MCGEKSCQTGDGSLALGSPPHVRGKGCTTHVLLPFSGITPAYAGKSYRCPVRSCFPEDHPRVCGEKGRGHRPARCGRGSPPHVRGKGLLQIFVTKPLGITPACAGKSRSGLGLSPAPTDHPRMCGEKEEHSMGFAVKTGSPPHVRGKAFSMWLYTPCMRITPAYAGKSFLYVFLSLFKKDHPRVCGEKVVPDV